MEARLILSPDVHAQAIRGVEGETWCQIAGWTSTPGCPPWPHLLRADSEIGWRTFHSRAPR